MKRLLEDPSEPPQKLRLKPIPPENFFPAPTDQAWIERLKSLREDPTPPSHPLFFKQDEAFHQCDSTLSNERLLSWAFERPDFNGGRRYMVCSDEFQTQLDSQALSYNNFWDMYEKLSPENKTFYEILREGYPCALYFDIGYYFLDSSYVHLFGRI